MALTDNTTPQTPSPDVPDVIDRAAGLAAGYPLFAARRFRAPVVVATQASHDALLLQPVAGLSVADRQRVAVQVCQASGAATLAQHYRQMLVEKVGAEADASSEATSNPKLAAMQHFATTLTTEPRHGDRAAIEALKAAGLNDAGIVALAQLVAFLAYQTRVVAGLQAMQAEKAGTP